MVCDGTCSRSSAGGSATDGRVRRIERPQFALVDGVSSSLSRAVRMSPDRQPLGAVRVRIAEDTDEVLRERTRLRRCCRVADRAVRCEHDGDALVELVIRACLDRRRVAAVEDHDQSTQRTRP